MKTKVEEIIERFDLVAREFFKSVYGDFGAEYEKGYYGDVCYAKVTFRVRFLDVPYSRIELVNNLERRDIFYADRLFLSILQDCLRYKVQSLASELCTEAERERLLAKRIKMEELMYQAGTYIPTPNQLTEPQVNPHLDCLTPTTKQEKKHENDPTNK